MRHNGLSVIIGIVLTFVLCLIWGTAGIHAIQATDSMSLWIGVITIVALVFLYGLKNIEVAHMAVLKIFGERRHINFHEGWCWIPGGIASIEIIDCRLDVIDVPLIKILTKNNVEVGVDIWAYCKINDPFINLGLKSPQETIKTSVVSKCNEATSEFVKENTDKQCRDHPDILQQKIKEKMAEEEKKLGVEVSDIDLRPIEPTDQFKQIYTEDFKKKVKTQRFTKGAKQVARAIPGSTPSEIANTTLVAQGDVPKKIEEQKKTLKLDIEPNILAFAANFLPKKEKTEKGGKK